LEKALVIDKTEFCLGPRIDVGGVALAVILEIQFVVAKSSPLIFFLYLDAGRLKTRGGTSAIGGVAGNYNHLWLFVFKLGLKVAFTNLLLVVLVAEPDHAGMVVANKLVEVRMHKVLVLGPLLAAEARTLFVFQGRVVLENFKIDRLGVDIVLFVSN